MLNGVLAGLLTLLPPGFQSAPAPPKASSAIGCSMFDQRPI